ncbi:hypothetical protein RN001_011479 [Aquatica leii]|uniref:Coiled-coil protein 142 C-terminal domain-containing protein n=1 Tax=Aquatica leii TaxID=1421715 RepID=A0AAN7SCU9_9COLE|nr:hypothetical protein RN001_011479 [Aquatica leii]
MSRNIITITKWVPLENEENKILFQECNETKMLAINLLNLLGQFFNEFRFRNGWKSYHTTSENELILEKLEIISEMAESLRQNLYRVFDKLNISRPIITKIKVKLWKDILWKTKLKISYFLQQLIHEIAFLFVHYGEKMLVLTFKISDVYNHYLHMDFKYKLKFGATICSNTCPYLMYPLRKISITKLLQILAQNRAELCCHKLIDCLLDTYKSYEIYEDDASSDNSSLEIYRAITKHMSPPVTEFQDFTTKAEESVTEIDNFANMEELVKYEEQNVLDLLETAIRIAPTMLGDDSVKKSKASGELKISVKAKTKVLDYYQQILWGEVGNFLEHIILWWGALPLAERPPHSSQHLREWITQFLPTIEIPNFILSALINLADSLGMYITSTSWDQHFRLALVASKAPLNIETGRTFNDLLQNLVLLSNQCETTSDWILGAPLDELPLVEQIPILHRLDHSIHTTRLWAINETKRFANNWDVEKFFTITHCDIVNCLAQLNHLKMNDHSADIEKGGFSAHVNVCVNMRAKLRSEVSINHEKLKMAQQQCIDTLASVCRMISLANLQMIFPENNYYKKHNYEKPAKASGYVAKYLDEILTPVLAATQDYNIANMILKIMCECWLDHIYINKVRFSHYGAYQLLTDFASIGTWLVNCPIVTPHMRKEMLRNEVLRRCEGVGKLLLRCPGEQLRMNEKIRPGETESPKSDNTELMPPEMYVPNQEQWLELRAHKRKTLFKCTLCCANVNY